MMIRYLDYLLAHHFLNVFHFSHLIYQAKCLTIFLQAGKKAVLTREKMLDKKTVLIRMEIKTIAIKITVF